MYFHTNYKLKHYIGGLRSELKCHLRSTEADLDVCCEGRDDYCRGCDQKQLDLGIVSIEFYYWYHLLYGELCFNLHFSLARPKNLGRTRAAASAMPHAYTTMIAVRFGSERINILFNIIIKKYGT